MKKMVFVILGAALALGLLTGCGSGGQSADTSKPVESDRSEGSTQPEQGTAAELGSLRSFSAGTLDGGTFSQEDIQAKDMTVIDFWSVTCRPCIAEMPDLAEFAKALPDNVQVVTVCLDGMGNETFAQEILKKAGFEGVTLISGNGDLLDLCANLMYTPTVVLVDSEGDLVGDAIVGGQEDLSGTFLKAVNEALEAGGKDKIELES